MNVTCLVRGHRWKGPYPVLEGVPGRDLVKLLQIDYCARCRRGRFSRPEAAIQDGHAAAVVNRGAEDAGCSG